MGKAQKTLTIALWCLVVVLMAGLLVRTMFREEELPAFSRAPAFSLLDQDGRTLTNASLMGKAWIADFVFTRCQGPCPIMTRRMAELQPAIHADKARLVSFSVDPEHDTPAVLKAYAKANSADEDKWIFATGRMSDIYDIAAGMKIFAKPAEGENPIIHSTKFILVDQKGWIRGYYAATEPREVEQLLRDLASLTR
jgi:protein SCO1/2